MAIGCAAARTCRGRSRGTGRRVRSCAGAGAEAGHRGRQGEVEKV